MNVELLKEEKQILLHTLGLSEGMQFYDKDKIDNPYRNYFNTTKDTVDFPYIQSLVEKGLMFNFRPSYFAVTETGIKLAKEIAFNSIEKLSRSKKRYALYLHCDIDQSFSEWIKDPYWNDYRKRNGVL
jgi:hypothetical protein